MAPTDDPDADDPEADDETVRLLVDDGAEQVALGDSRQKHVAVVTAAGTREEHGDVYLRHAADRFEVSPDPSFPADETTVYPKDHLARVEVTQHHAACFITTAAAGEGPTLDALRGFREDALRPSPVGRLLLAGYDAVSPPVARTLARHPSARTTRAVRWLVDACAGLARRRAASGRRPVRAAYALVLTAAYVAGVALAVAGSATLWLGEARGR